MMLREALAEDIRTSAARLIAEDIGAGDITAQLVPARQWAKAEVVAHEAAILCGVPWVDEVYRRIDPSVQLSWHHSDGDALEPGRPFLELAGPARSLMSGERAALNVLQLLTATATRTRRYVELVKGSGVELLDTRRTLPGLRLAQKYAVLCGGGRNHRLGLYDAFLIGENHIAACGGIAAAVEAARKIASDLDVEIAVKDLDELDQAIAAGADIVMLDGFALEAMSAAAQRARGRVTLEATGEISEQNLAAIAATGVERIAVGALTEGVEAVELTMQLTYVETR